MARIESNWNLGKLEVRLKKMASDAIYSSLDKYGKEGVAALQAATPVASGFTASQWYYRVVREAKGWSIIWGNDHVVDGTPVVILLEFGHGTGNGGYVPGHPFINEALKPVFERARNEVWKEVTAK